MKALTHRFVLLAVAAAFLLSGCGEDVPGITGDEIKVGTWAALSGPALETVRTAKAIETYFNYVNDQGGVHGRKLILITKDDGYDPSRTPGVVQELVEQDQVFAIIGGQGTASGMAVKDYLILNMVPWVNPDTGARAWTMPVNAYIFSIYPSYVTQGQILARYAVQEMGADRIGLLYQDDSFGHEGQEGVRTGLRGVGKEPLVEVSYKIGETDFSSHAQKLKDQVLDTVVLVAVPSHAARLLEEIQKGNDKVKFRSQEFRPKFLGANVISDRSMIELAEPQLWEGAVVATTVPDPNSDEPGVVRAREIAEKYSPDVAFGTFELMGFIQAELFVEGMRRAGPSPNRIRLLLAYEAMENWSDNILGQPITFSRDSHLGFDSVRLMKVEGGKYVPITDWMKAY
jgi:branched-chain amino acid transport system substrate-binding protein